MVCLKNYQQEQQIGSGGNNDSGNNNNSGSNSSNSSTVVTKIKGRAAGKILKALENGSGISFSFVEYCHDGFPIVELLIENNNNNEENNKSVVPDVVGVDLLHRLIN